MKPVAQTSLLGCLRAKTDSTKQANGNACVPAGPKGDYCLENTAASPHARRVYKYYDLVMASFVTVLLCSGIIGVQKISVIDGHPFGAAILFFPLSYLFGDVLTEVYGYARSRRVIWAGFGALIFAAFKIGRAHV